MKKVFINLRIPCLLLSLAMMLIYTAGVIQGTLADPEHIVSTGSISGFLWADGTGNPETNWDGLYNGDEGPLEGYTVYLYAADDLTSVPAIAQTGEDGIYLLNDIEPGSYVLGLIANTVNGIEYLLPLAMTADNVFATDHNDAFVAYTDVVEVGAGQSILSINAGLRPVIEEPEEPAQEPEPKAPEELELTGVPCSISGFMWADGYETEWDGLYEGHEAFLANCPVYLYAAGDISSAIATAQTGSDGVYLFDNLEPGDYVLGIASHMADGNTYLPPFEITADNWFAANGPLTAYTDTIGLKAGQSAEQINAGMRILESGLPFKDIDLGFQFPMPLGAPMAQGGVSTFASMPELWSKDLYSEVIIDSYTWFVVKKQTVDGMNCVLLVKKGFTGSYGAFGSSTNYEGSDLQKRMTAEFTTWCPQIRKIAVIPTLGSHSSTGSDGVSKPTARMADGVQSKDVIFALSYRDVYEISGNTISPVHKIFSRANYPTYGTITCFYLRTSYNSAYVYGVRPNASNGTIDYGIHYLATGAGDVPAVWVNGGYATQTVTVKYVNTSNELIGSPNTQTFDVNTGSAWSLAPSQFLTVPNYTYNHWKIDTTGAPNYGGVSIPSVDNPVTVYLVHTYDTPVVNTVKVTYKANNGKSEPDCVQNAGTPGSSVVTVSQSHAGFTAPAGKPVFTGWNTMADGSGIPYNASALLTVNSNIILYAQWAEDNPGDIFKDVAYEKNAYINGSQTAQNGSAAAYEPVKRNDTILYQIKINNQWPGSIVPPTVPNPYHFQSKATPPGKIHFINGSFEEPVIGGPVAAASGNGIYYNYFWQADVPGWSTRPTYPKVPPDPYTYCIEFQKPRGTANFAWYAPDGNQYAELNANVEGTLYQVCDTVPGTKVYYEFYHAAKPQRTGNNTDVMNFYLRAEGQTSGGLQRVCSDSATGPASSNYQWGHYTGSYVVPAGQTRTEFSFESVSTTSGNPDLGNYLDAIRLYTNSYINLTKSNNAPGGRVRVGDVVTYTINVQNTGESDARNLKITDILPIGTEFVPGTVKIDNVPAPAANYSYNAATRELSIHVGAGATASQGGLISGDGSFSADCNNIYTVTFQIKVNGSAIAQNLLYENQSKVTYEDRYDTDPVPTLLTNYSNVDAFGWDGRGCGAALTDVLPDGLEYISHTDANGSISAIAGQTCTWTWANLPYGETTVTVEVKVKPNMETAFVNYATLVINGEGKVTNNTYHELVPTYTDVTISKTVTGSFADKNKYFTFTLSFKDATNTPLTGTISYTGGAIPGLGATAPANGILTLAGGQATVTLKHGQTVTLLDVPANALIRIQETPVSNYSPSFTDSAGTPGSPGTFDTDFMVVGINGIVERTFAFFNGVIVDIVPTGIMDDFMSTLALPVIAVLFLLGWLAAGVMQRRLSA